MFDAQRQMAAIQARLADLQAEAAVLDRCESPDSVCSTATTIRDPHHASRSRSPTDPARDRGTRADLSASPTQGHGRHRKGQSKGFGYRGSARESEGHHHKQASRDDPDPPRRPRTPQTPPMIRRQWAEEADRTARRSRHQAATAELENTPPPPSCQPVLPTAQGPAWSAPSKHGPKRVARPHFGYKARRSLSASKDRRADQRAPDRRSEPTAAEERRAPLASANQQQAPRADLRNTMRGRPSAETGTVAPAASASRAHKERSTSPKKREERR
jgi:hypothetical protein